MVKLFLFLLRGLAQYGDSRGKSKIKLNLLRLLNKEWRNKFVISKERRGKKSSKLNDNTLKNEIV